MTIRFICECGKKLKASDEKIGKKILCSQCGQPLVIPSKSTVGQETAGTSKASSGSSPSGTEKPKASAAEVASQQLKKEGGSVSSIAKDLVRKVEEENRQKNRKGAKPQDVFSEKKQVEYDYSYLVKDLGLKIAGVLAACVLCFMFGQWLFKEKLDLPELASVSGVITDASGKPLPNVTVSFIPEKKDLAEGEVKRSSSVGITDNEGKYVLTYVANVNGAVLGAHKITLMGSGIPGQYMSLEQTELKLNVEKGGTDQANFQVK